MNSRKYKAVKKLAVIFFIFIACTGGVMLASFYLYQQYNLDSEKVFSEGEFKDFSVEGDIITSNSGDPFLIINFEESKYVKTIEFEIDEMNQTDVSAEIFAVGNHWDQKRLELRIGKNTVCFDGGLDEKKYIRLDLAERPGVSIKLGNITVNEYAAIAQNSLKNSLKIVCVLSVIYLAVVLKEANVFQKRTNKLMQRCSDGLAQLRASEDFSKAVRLFFKCSFIYVLGIIAIIRADFLFIDDIGRNYNGDVRDWDAYNRYFSEIICKILSGNNIVNDTSPLPQIMSMVFMAVAATIVIWAMAPEKLDSNWMVLAAVPFAVSPYFLENISFKIEGIIHGVSVLLCILPLLLYKRRDFWYVMITSICITLMCITYQGATGIFPITIVLLASQEWNSGIEVKKVIRLIYTSVIGYVSGLLFFKIVIMRPIETHVSSEMLSIEDFFPGVIKNLVTFYDTIYNDFNKSWLVLLLIIIILFILAYVWNSKHSFGIALWSAIITTMLMGSLSFGIYPLLQNCVYYPRAMYGFCIALSLLCIYIISKGMNIAKIVVFLISWSFFTFSFTYGNCLALQQEYTNVKMQSILDYLNQHYKEEVSYTLEINGTIGLAPAIRNKTSSMVLLDKIIPETLHGGWIWSEYKLYKYYGIPSNYTFLWAGDSVDPERGLSYKNLPRVDSCMWFDVFSDGSNILIKLK